MAVRKPLRHGGKIPNLARCAAVLYAPVMAVVSRVWDDRDVLDEQLNLLRSQLQGPPTETTTHEETVS